MFCLNEGGSKPRKRTREREKVKEPRVSKTGQLAERDIGSHCSKVATPIETRYHCAEGPTTLVVPRSPASRLRSIKRVLIDPSIDAWMANAARTNSSYCRALTSDLSCICLHSAEWHSRGRNKLPIGNFMRFNQTSLKTFYCITVLIN